MRTKINDWFFRFITVTLISLSGYILFCAWSYTFLPVQISIDHILIINPDETIERTLTSNFDDKLYIKKTQDIAVVYRISRKIDGKVTINKDLVDNEGISHKTFSHTTRVYKTATFERVFRRYDIPKTLKTGCGNMVYSEHEYIIFNNILSIINPIYIMTPITHFCIK